LQGIVEMAVVNMRLALGCMRLSAADDEASLVTLDAAQAAGVGLFDTARAYGRTEHDAGHNERLVGQALFSRGSRGSRGRPDAPVRVVTKCGMRREGGLWVPDGRARRIAQDVEESVDAVGAVRIDTLLLHAPDPRTPLATTARAVARAADRAGIARVGVSNVSRKQLEELAAHMTIASVEVALGAYDDLALRNGVVAYCLERGIEVLAHAPLGGPKRAARLARDGVLVSAAPDGATAIETFLAYLLALPAGIVPVVGARTPEHIASFVRAARLVLAEEALAAIDVRFPALGALRRPRTATAAVGGEVRPQARREVVLMMGIPGAGKSRAAERLVAEGYERLNRDTLGGTLRGIVSRLEERLRAGGERFVLDNTYVTRATRYDVLRVAHAYSAEVRCVFFDTPPHEAQVNVLRRMIERFGSVLDPVELARRSKEDPAALVPSAIHRMTRDLEPPASDEGFATVERVPFARIHGESAVRAGVAVSLDLGETEAARIVHAAPEDAACLLYAWRPDGAADALATGARIAAAESRIVDVAVCTHAGGPPICWCRPPLPGMWISFAHRHGVDPRRSVLHSASTTDRAMARALCMQFIPYGGVNAPER
jgi:aryl-alcohol dehydrogenase-like predicted oxidoreductase/adenylate kinase family enzyme